jgi:hypothetical protein
MNGWDKLTLNSVKLAAGTELVYGEGDVLSIGSVTDAVTLNVFGVAGQIKDGFDTGITLAEGQDVAALKELLTVDGVDSFDLKVTDGRVWLSSNSTVQSDWDINWGAELAKAPASVPQGGVGTLSMAAHDGISIYELYGNTTYTVADGGIAISLTGDGANNAIVVGGNDDYRTINLHSVKNIKTLTIRQLHIHKDDIRVYLCILKPTYTLIDTVKNTADVNIVKVCRQSPHESLLSNKFIFDNKNIHRFRWLY